MDVDDVRSAYLDFFRERGHAVVARASLVPEDDPTTLFVGSGMQPLEAYLLGEPSPYGDRLVDSQPCVRGNDVADVGDDRHTTFFEMLGNWSLGDYFKGEQIPWVYAFLTDRLGLDPSRLYVSCFAGDDRWGIGKDTESAALWARLFAADGVDAGEVELGSLENAAAVGSGDARICFYDEKNWWSRADSIEAMPVGDPGGTDSEMFYLFPDLEHDPAYGAHCHPNCDCGRFIEIGNSDFMAYQRTSDGIAPLPKRNVDFGGGLERIAAAVIDSPDVFRVSLLWPIVEHLEQLTGASYDDHRYEFRVIADHLRGATFLAVDGVRPSNKEQGSFLRRLVRRAISMAKRVGLDEDFLGELVPTIADLYHDTYPEVAAQRTEVVDVLVKEERRFRRTLDKGLAQLRSIQGRDVTGSDLFTLKDTYGFPVELSVEEAHAEGLTLADGWRDDYDALLAEQRARSKAARR